jgi:hypothetical protein
MKLLGFNKVLCLSPHPDDVEYSMLGTILKYTDTQFYLLQLEPLSDRKCLTEAFLLLKVVIFSYKVFKSGQKCITPVFSYYYFLLFVKLIILEYDYIYSVILIFKV